MAKKELRQSRMMEAAARQWDTILDPCNASRNVASVIHKLRFMEWRLLTIGEKGRPEQKWANFDDIVQLKWAVKMVKQHPAGQLAIATGEQSRVVVIAFRGKEGINSMQQLKIKPHVRIPSGDFHWYVEYPQHLVPLLRGEWLKELRTRYPGVSVKGDGQYVTVLGRDKKGRGHKWLRPAEPDPWEKVPLSIRHLYSSREFVIDESPSVRAKRDEIENILKGYHGFYQGQYERALREGTMEPNEHWVEQQVREHARSLYSTNPSLCNRRKEQ